MIRKTIISMASVAVLCLVDVVVLNVAQAFNFGNVMNPSRWFDNDDYYDRGYRGYGGPYGGYGPYGYGGGPWGGYGGGPYGWGGYGGPWGGYPGYGGGYPSTIVVNPNASGAASQPAPRLPE